MSPLLLASAVFDGFHFGLRFLRMEGTKAVIQRPEFQGRYIGDTSHPYWRHWRVPAIAVGEHRDVLFHALAQVATANKIRHRDTRASFWETCQRAIDNPKPTAFVHGFATDIYPMDDGGAVFVGTYHPVAIAVAKAMTGVYMPDIRGWRVPKASPFILRDNLVDELGLDEKQAARIRILAGNHSFVEGKLTTSDITIAVPDSLAPEGTSSGEDQVQAGAILAEMPTVEASPEEVRALAANLDGYELDEYQRVGVRHLVGSTSALLADDPGLGKTRQAIVAAFLIASYYGRQILVASPATLLANWEHEIRLMLPDEKVSIRDPQSSARWVLINYELLPHLRDQSHRFVVMITDEAHYLKEPNAERTRVAFSIASPIPFRFLLTGTPILNREDEIHTLLKLSGHPLGQMALRNFLEQFSGSAPFRANLHQQLKSWMLRRRKALVLTNLKGRKEQVLRLALTANQTAEYTNILSRSDIYPMEKITRLRQFLELVKVEPLAEFASSLGGEDKIILFCEYQQTVKALVNLLGSLKPASIVGTDSISKRRKAECAFRDDPDCRAMIGTIATIGTGLNLQAANYVAFCCVPWTPALKDQAESRADRKGQTRLVISKVPLVDGTIDDNLWKLLHSKQEIFDQVIDADAAIDKAKASIASTIH